MAQDAYLAEIRMFAGNFAPRGWAFCNGQLLPISQFAAVFSLVGTFYGGNGTSTFALPNLQGNIPVGQGQGPGLSLYVLGETAGVTAVTVTQSTMPSHTHTAHASVLAGNQPGPNGNSIAKLPAGDLDFVPTSVTSPAPAQYGGTLSFAGGNQPHNNMQPYLAVSYIICLQGIFPSRN